MGWDVIMTERDGTETLLSTHDDVESAGKHLKSYKEWDTRGILKFRIEETK